MTSLDRSNAPQTREIEAAFAELLQRGAVDIVQNEDTGDLEIRSDTWTLALQGVPPRVAFLAIDEEPAEESELATALDATVTADDLRALEQLNSDLSGSIVTALHESGDPLSIALAKRLE